MLSFIYVILRICDCLTPPGLFGPTDFRWCLCCKEQVRSKLDKKCSLSPFFLWVKAACFVVAASVLYYYWYKRTSEYLGDPRLYEDSPWLREAYARVRQWRRFLLKLEGLCQMPGRTILSHCSGGPNLSRRDTLTSCHFFILLMKYKFMKLFWKCLSFESFVSLDSMCWFKYSKTFWPFRSDSVFGRMILNPFHQVLFPGMTAADAAEAEPSALRTLWGVTPSAGWTVTPGRGRRVWGEGWLSVFEWQMPAGCRPNSPTLQFYENAPLLFVCQTENKCSGIRLVQVLRKNRWLKGDGIFILCNRTWPCRPTLSLCWAEDSPWGRWEPDKPKLLCSAWSNDWPQSRLAPL